FPRCQLYRPPGGATDTDASLRRALERLAGAGPTYGYRRLTAMLRRAGWGVDGKRVRRVTGEVGVPGAVAARPDGAPSEAPGRPAATGPGTGATGSPASPTWSRGWRSCAPIRCGWPTSPTSACGGTSSTWQLSWMSLLVSSVAGTWDAASPAH